jgi:C-terminal processing protease CtpA/Prc
LKRWKPATSVDDMAASLKTYHKHSFLESSLKPELHEKMPIFRLGKDKIGYICIYTYFSPNRIILKQMTQLVHTFLDNDMIGLIIDLRLHEGGSFWPVVSFFDRYLNNSTLLSFGETKHNQRKWVNLINKKIVFNQPFRSTSPNRIPIAILTGRKTKSSGEFAAALFKGRPNCKSFGDRTFGKLSSNQTFKLSKSLNLVLTTTLMTTYDGMFQENEYLHVDKRTDQPIFEAKKWIRSL